MVTLDEKTDAERDAAQAERDAAKFVKKLPQRLSMLVARRAVAHL